MKKANGILWGLVLIAAGVVFALNALEITDVDLFFDGWWTLFLIVPCGIGLFTEQKKTGNLIGLSVGVLLLLAAQDILSFDVVWKLAVPAIIIAVGLKMVFGNLFDSTAAKIRDTLAQTSAAPRAGTAVFAGQELNFAGEVFEGAELNAVFGGIQCDLRGAVFEKDSVIRVSAVFGGVDILVPDTVNVKVKSASLFGGISDKTARHTAADAVTLYIDGTCLFGGVDIQ